MDRLTPHNSKLSSSGRDEGFGAQSEPDFAAEMSSHGGHSDVESGRLVSLADLPFMGKGRITAMEGVSANGTAHDVAVRRLQELGLHPGTEIAVCHRAPLGDPRCYGFRGTHVCLRKTEAARIQVRILDEAHTH
jgi:Fe2+ transport system protein FeoA